MAKIQIPPDGIALCGSIGACLDFASWKGQNYARSFPHHTYTNTAGQRVQRQKFADAVKAYRETTYEERILWRARAAGMAMSGYELYIRTEMLK